MRNLSTLATGKTSPAVNSTSKRNGRVHACNMGSAMASGKSKQEWKNKERMSNRETHTPLSLLLIRLVAFIDIVFFPLPAIVVIVDDEERESELGKRRGEENCQKRRKHVSLETPCDLNTLTRLTVFGRGNEVQK